MLKCFISWATDKMKAKLIQAHGQIKLRASYTIVVEDGEKVVYVRDGVSRPFILKSNDVGHYRKPTQ